MLPFRTLLFSAICLCLSIPLLQAQSSGEEAAHKVVIIKKIVDQNGKEETIEVRLTGEEAEGYIIENDGELKVGPLEDGEGHQIIQMEVDMDTDGIVGDSFEGKTSIFLREKNSSELKEISKKEMENIDQNSIANINVEKNDTARIITIDLKAGDQLHESKAPHGDKPFLGIYMNVERRVEDGVEITGTSRGVTISKVVEGSAAEKGGLLIHDLILSMNGKAVVEVDALIDQIRTFKVGDKVTLEILRGQEKLTKEIILGAKPSMQGKLRDREYRFLRGEQNRILPVMKDPCKPIIGFYHRRTNGEGVGIQRVISNTPAERQALREGDVVLEMDGVKIKSWDHLIELRDLHKAGDKFKLLIERDGQSKKIKARFNYCERNEEVEVETISDAGNSEVTQEIDLDLSVFPNPSNGIINIDYKGEATPVVITVSDLSGKEIYKMEFPNFDGRLKKTINLEQNGLNTAIIAIQQGDEIFTEKVIIQPKS